MAGKLKPAGGAKPPKKPPGKKGKGPTLAVDNSRKASGGGKNTVTRAEAVADYEEIFELHRELNETSAAIRKRIGDAYATTAKKHGTSKKVTKHLFKLEKARREVEAAEREFDSRDREGFELAAQMFGDDLPFGQFAAQAAARAKKDGFAGKTKADDSEGEEG